MSQRLQNVIRAFNITPQVLEDRKNIGTYIASLASLIIDRFYDYFLSNPEFAKVVDKADIPRLKRMRIDLLVSLFHDELDEKLLQKISRIHLDSPLKMDRYLISSAFEILQQTVIDISSVNNQLRKDLKIILKFLHISEFIVQEEFAKNTVDAVSHKTQLISALEIFFEMLFIHKNKNETLNAALQNNSFSRQDNSQLPSEDGEHCPFNKSLAKIKEQFKNIDEFNIDIDNIDKWHQSYHKEVKKLYDLEKVSADHDAMLRQMQVINDVSNELFEHISKPFEHSASLTFLSVSSGMRFIQHYNNIINETKFIAFNNPKKMAETLHTIIKNSLEKSLSWALASYNVSDTRIDTDAEINEQIVLNNAVIYICIHLKEIPYKTFVIDVIKVFLEILKTTLVNREKEHALIALADRAESANRSKDMFLANMSHELRTPLNAIIGFSQILKVRPEIPETMRPYIEKISIAGNNLLNLVNTILDFAKLEAGKISYHPKMTLISEVIKEVSVITLSMAEAKNIRMNFPGDISLALYIDPQLIKQVLINLLSNAIKFTPENGSIDITIEFNRIQNEYTIGVCDNGVGMSKEAVAKLFTPFTQIDNHLQNASKGTGLGLVITKRIVEDMHGGRIWVESEENKGSCFYFTLPVSDELNKVEMFSSQKEKAQKLLIVEDNEEYVSILVEKLLPHFNLTVTNSINKAKELLSSSTYDKIVLDFFLIDGISSELLFYMDDNDINTPVYILSAEDDYRIVTHLQESKSIVGVFNKKDASLICDTLVRVASE